MMLLLLGMLGLVFVTAWAMMNTLTWGFLLAATVLVGGAVLGASSDID